MIIWLVDDEMEMLEGIRTLTESDPEIHTVGDLELITISTLREFKSKVGLVESGEISLPSLIFLDLRFRTAKEGFEALEIIKHHSKKKIRAIPTIMFSSARKDDEVKKSYELSVNEYVEKGADHFERFKKVLLHWNNEAVLLN